MVRFDSNDEQIKNFCRDLEYTNTWDIKTKNRQIKKVLKTASKKGSGNPGFPDYLNINETEKLLIMMEIKPSLAQHKSGDNSSFDPEKFAVDGIIWYLERFFQENLSTQELRDYFTSWKFVGIAVSGDIDDEYNHLISTYIINNNKIIEQSQITGIRNEEDYLAVFDNINEEELINKIATSSKKINKWLRSVDSQKRPILLSALMVCLFKIKGDDADNSFISEYNSNNPSTIVNKIENRVKAVLKSENIPEDKINVLLAELQFVYHDNDLNNHDILKNILNELRDTVIPLFERKSNYDIIGKFYEDFLKWAGVANVKKGIVLTPSHITTLFTELIDLKYNDVIIDTGCGTGAFLIAGMNSLLSIIQTSSMSNKDEKIAGIKEKQLIGFDKSPLMYSLAISSMLFRGDGKSLIYNVDSFSTDADKIIKQLSKKGINPTIGFINPPYGGKDTQDNPTKKEIQFLTRLLDLCSRYVIMIAPLSTYFKESKVRNQILKKHTLKCVINMPKELFMPNANTNTAISVFETNKPQNDQKVVFYDLKDDGFVLSKNKGRTDLYGKWKSIKEDMLIKISEPEKYQDGINLVYTNIKNNDEWLIQDHSIIDYSSLNTHSFQKSIKEYLVFKAKKNMNMLGQDIDEINVLDILDSYYNQEEEKGNDETT